MTSVGLLQVAIYFLVLLALTKPVGSYMAKVFQGQRTFMHPVLRPIEKIWYRLCGVKEDTEQRWTHYAASVLAFSFASFIFVYLIQRLQGVLPLNPQGFSTAHAPNGATPMTPDLAFNTANSFLTNTNWQAYSGESTVSYFVQMAALAVQNFASAAVGIAVAIALVRGFARQQVKEIGNFWVDMSRAVLYVLLPISIIAALVLCSSGAIQNFKAYEKVTTVEGATQTIPQGPVASQEAIKMLGTNGGGIFNANSAHPYENPTPWTNFVQILLIFVIPAGLTYTFGSMVGDTRQGWAIFAACSIMFLGGVWVVYHYEQAGNPMLNNLGLQSVATDTQAGGNMEGKETRFGIAATALFAVITTDASCGAINGWHDSFTPLAGLIPMVNLQTDEVIFGGTGAGLYGILLYAILAVFIAGLMVGRTPEYLGKKIRPTEMKYAALYFLTLPVVILTAAGLSLGLKNWPSPTTSPLSSILNPGPHGLTEIMYAFTSMANNNGSAFAGLTTNTIWYNTVGGIVMLLGRFAPEIFALGLAGSLARQARVPASEGTLDTRKPLFVGMLVAVILILVGLTYFPALALGPFAEGLH
jgi:potassium-transporting ATPase potassium-binding subunit